MMVNYSTLEGMRWRQFAKSGHQYRAISDTMTVHVTTCPYTDKDSGAPMVGTGVSRYTTDPPPLPHQGDFLHYKHDMVKMTH